MGGGASAICAIPLLRATCPMALCNKAGSFSWQIKLRYSATISSLSRYSSMSKRVKGPLFIISKCI